MYAVHTMHYGLSTVSGLVNYVSEYMYSTLVHGQQVWLQEYRCTGLTWSLFRSAGRVEPRAGVGGANIGRGHRFRVLHGREVLPPVVGGDAEETEDNLGKREGGGREKRTTEGGKVRKGSHSCNRGQRHSYSAHKEHYTCAYGCEVDYDSNLVKARVVIGHVHTCICCIHVHVSSSHPVCGVSVQLKVYVYVC